MSKSQRLDPLHRAAFPASGPGNPSAFRDADLMTVKWLQGRWRSWWERHRDLPRVEWMLEGLAHAEPEVRLSAAAELRAASQQEFGYAFDGPKRARGKKRPV